MLGIRHPACASSCGMGLHAVLAGIGGGRSLGLGPNRVRSLPDGIGQVLDMYLREKAGALAVIEEKKNGNGNGGFPLAYSVPSGA